MSSHCSTRHEQTGTTQAAPWQTGWLFSVDGGGVGGGRSGISVTNGGGELFYKFVSKGPPPSPPGGVETFAYTKLPLGQHSPPPPTPEKTKKPLYI